MTTRRRAHTTKLSLPHQKTRSFVAHHTGGRKSIAVTARGATRHPTRGIVDTVMRSVWDIGKVGKPRAHSAGGTYRPVLRRAGWKPAGWRFR